MKRLGHPLGVHWTADDHRVRALILQLALIDWHLHAGSGFWDGSVEPNIVLMLVFAVIGEPALADGDHAHRRDARASEDIGERRVESDVATRQRRVAARVVVRKPDVRCAWHAHGFRSQVGWVHRSLVCRSLEGAPTTANGLPSLSVTMASNRSTADLYG